MKNSVPHPDSTLLMRPHDGGAERQQDLVMCVHCGRHWLIGDAIATNVRKAGEPDPATRFGFCARCNGVYCPGGKCSPCVPREQQIENIEAGIPVLTPKAPMISLVGLDLQPLTAR